MSPITATLISILLVIASFLFFHTKLKRGQPKRSESEYFYFLLHKLRSLARFDSWGWNLSLNDHGLQRITDLNLCKKIMSHPALLDRVKTKSFIHLATFGKPLGLLMGCGEEYRKTRQLTIKLLRHIGFYNNGHIEMLLTKEISRLLDKLKQVVNHNCASQHDDEQNKNKGALWRPKAQFHRHTINIIWQVVFGEQPTRTGPLNIEQIMKNIERGNRNYSLSYLLGGRSGALARALNLLNLLWAWWKGSRDFYKVAKGIISAKMDKLEGLRGSEVFIDAYLLEQGKLKVEGLAISGEALLVLLRDIIIGGGETVGTALEFAVLHIALNPSVQERLYSEIELTVGRSRFPKYSDRSSMPYTQATILEILRIGSAVSPGARVAREDVTMDGLFFPKGSVVTLDHYAIHRSKDLWDDPPQSFRPERFLNEDQTSIVHRENIIPFGYGKRFCIGENVAQVALFLFLTSLIQKFTIEIPSELPPPSLQTLRGVSRSPVPYTVRIFSRGP